MKFYCFNEDVGLIQEILNHSWQVQYQRKSRSSAEL